MYVPCMKCTIVVRVEEKFTILELAFARGKQESQAIYIPSTLSAVSVVHMRLGQGAIQPASCHSQLRNQQISFIYTFSARKSSLSVCLTYV